MSLTSIFQSFRPGETNSTGSASNPLLAIPSSLVSRHLKPTSNLNYCMYYGKDRAANLKRLHEFTVVITTYSVLRKDWKSSQRSSEPGADPNSYTIIWRRVVLDEGQSNFARKRTLSLIDVAAHIIREPSRSFAQSVCALQAERRWAVTGTPIQNRLTDLYSLFKFLRCSPFSDLSVFNKHVVQQWKAQSDPQCVAKLKTLISCLSLRRPKTTIQLLSRTDFTIELQFNEWESHHYKQVAARTRSGIEAITAGSDGARLFNVLQWMNRLRLMCNHGPTTQVIEEISNMALRNSEKVWSNEVARSYFDHLDAVGLAKCSIPSCQQDLSSALSSEVDDEHEGEPFIDKSLTLLCHRCHEHEARGSGKFYKVCNHFPRVSIGSHGDEMDAGVASMQGSINELSKSPTDFRKSIPTKIQRIIEDLVNTPDGVKRSVRTSRFWHDY